MLLLRRPRHGRTAVKSRHEGSLRSLASRLAPTSEVDRQAGVTASGVDDLAQGALPSASGYSDFCVGPLRPAAVPFPAKATHHRAEFSAASILVRVSTVLLGSAPAAFMRSIAVLQSCFASSRAAVRSSGRAVV